MERRIIKGILLAMVVITSCYYDVEETLYPPTTCITDNMSYQTNIVPILERNCYSCHSVADGPNNGNIVVEGYTEVLKYVDSGQLSASINHLTGYSAMPQDAPKLGNCDIAKIDQWILDGAPNN